MWHNETSETKAHQKIILQSHSQTLLHLIHTLRRHVAVSNKLQSLQCIFLHILSISITIEYLDQPNPAGNFQGFKNNRGFPERTWFFPLIYAHTVLPLGCAPLPHDCWICVDVAFFAVRVGLEKATQIFQNHIKWVTDFDLTKSI